MAAQGKSQKTVTVCPACGQRIVLRGSVEANRRLVCSHCGTDLKVLKTEPVKLGKAYRE
jgi:DNA-directed RNA polymerase subunit RPC12/RpoP